ncbi:MAG TPA: triose-phosphate isomerase [Anaerolineae bacterium]|nr:triose-phosphate isomerase [Anaerolineae bacterium]HMR62406.1 triose-phosphate isomerase [Anaerolineae bacterium]
MRTPIIAGNWKMHKTVEEAKALAEAVCEAVAGIQGVDVVLCPTFTALSAVKEVVKDTKVGLGAQNMYWEEQGAFTGEISPGMVAELCQYVILGHSERRQFFGETDEGVNKKIKAALAHNLTPIVCVGENLDQNEAGETVTFVGGQVKAAFAGLTAEEAAKIVVAYEPIWAIGTGKNADATTANSIIAEAVRQPLTQLYGEDVAQVIRVQYGGSVKPDNINGFMAQPDIDGALVGGASLKADSFVALITASA